MTLKVHFLAVQYTIWVPARYIGKHKAPISTHAWDMFCVCLVQVAQTLWQMDSTISLKVNMKAQDSEKHSLIFGVKNYKFPTCAHGKT